MIDSKTFRLDFFKQNKFKRSKCVKCGKDFWSLTERKTCGDSPCDQYDFIGNPIIPKKYDWKKMRSEYIRWFENNDHTSINRYPTVARWKPDTFYTGASIYCFMPWVLNQTAEPPANPLVMSQPSVRFVDIDNVGLGTARHMTIFEMMAHHAFNDKKTYWKERTVELCFEWLRHLKVKPEEITFKESWWEGGGNAGPCLEILSKGNELATLVFMEYLGPYNKKYKKMKMKVVDTGYGLERHVWASQGTPTIYDCTYPKIIEFLKKKSKAKYDKKILSEFCKICGSLEVGKDIEKLRNKIVNEISKKLGISEKEILDVILPFNKIYQIADHTKTIMFILGDGVVPSNVQEGYLARLLIRRSIRNLEDLGIHIPLSEIVKMQIQDVKNVYSEINENILIMVDIEEEKYKNTLKRGEKLVKRILLERKLDQNTLFMLYDSHGILPRDVKKFADVKIDLSDIETRIAVKKDSIKIPIERKIITGKLPETEKLYYKDEKKYEFTAKVLKVKGDKVILDRTAFYPRGGGQEPDLGKIGRYEVYDVEREGNVIVHFVKNPELKKNKRVKCKINSNRRRRIVRHHTATHIVNAAARKVLGDHVWQSGSKKDVDKAHLDITHYENITEEQIEKIENLANEIVNKKLKIRKLVLPRTEAEKIYGFRLYQGGAVPGKYLRIISTDFSTEACGGLHLDNTKDAQEIYIFNTRKIQDGIIRLEYVAGKELVEKTKKIVSKERKELKRKWEAKKEIIEKEKLKLRKIKKETEIPEENIIYIDTEGMKELEIIAKKFVRKNPDKFMIAIGKGIVYGIVGKKCENDIFILVKEVAKNMGGSAGGYKKEFRGGGPKKEKSKQAYEILKRVQNLE